MQERRPKQWQLLNWKLGILVSAVLLPWWGLTLAASNPTVLPTTSAENEARNLHLLERLSFGPRPGDLDYLRRVGTEHFIDEQLAPKSLQEPARLRMRLQAFQTLQQSPAELVRVYQPLLKQLRDLQKQQKAAKQADTTSSATTLADSQNMDDGNPSNQQSIKILRMQVKQPHLEAAQARFLRALQSPKQLQEVMTDFWYNHFNIYSEKAQDRFLIGAYEEQAIRPYALGRFRDLLGATAHHPAMLIYLDNWENTAPNSPGVRGRFKGLNENYARELMELHTLGVDNGYTQQDVISLAKILTGWGIIPAARMQRLHISGNGFYFDANRHDTSNKNFLGKVIRSGGMNEGEQALDILARHPATAHHLSFQLVQAFVNDTPPPTLVETLAKRYLATDGDISAVLKTLFHSPEFWAASNRGVKFKTPYRYVLSTVRASGVDTQNVFPLITTVQQMGMPLYGCLTPDGYKNTAEAWMSPDALTRRLNFATIFARLTLGITQAPPDFLTLGDGSALRKAMKQNASQGQPVEASLVEAAYGHQFKTKTLETVQTTSPNLKAALLLGSPERMQY